VDVGIGALLEKPLDNVHLRKHSRNDQKRRLAAANLVKNIAAVKMKPNTSAS
jgi:hypothetical protein